MDFFKIVSIHLGQLTNNEQKLYDYVIKNFSRIRNLTIREISRECFVSTTTFLRFVRKIGFSDFTEFITIVKFTEFEQEEQNQENFVVKQSEYRSEYIKNIKESIRIIDSDRLNRICEEFKKSEVIYFFGKGHMSPVIDYIHYIYTAAGLKVIAPQNQNYFDIATQEIKDTDVIVFFYFKHNLDELVSVLSQIKRKTNATIISITGADNNIIQNMSDINLYVFSDEITINKLDITSYSSFLSIMEVVLYSYIEKYK